MKTTVLSQIRHREARIKPSILKYYSARLPAKEIERFCSSQTAPKPKPTLNLFFHLTVLKIYWQVLDWENSPSSFSTRNPHVAPPKVLAKPSQDALIRFDATIYLITISTFSPQDPHLNPKK